MAEGLMGKGAAKHAVEIDAHQGGNKAAERGGANKGIVDHHMENRIDHGAISVKVKNAMAADGHHAVEYYHGGKM